MRRSLLATLMLATLGLSAPALATETFKVDSLHSAVEYRVKQANVSYALGLFSAVEGTFTLDPTDPTRSAFDFTVKADSLTTGNPGRDSHLKGPDFFNAKQFPTLTFRSKSVASAGQNLHAVKGDLTLHGVTKEVAVKVEHVGTGPGMRGGTAAGLLSEFTIKRSDFGMKSMIGPVGDDVRITVAVQGVRN